MNDFSSTSIFNYGAEYISSLQFSMPTKKDFVLVKQMLEDSFEDSFVEIEADDEELKVTIDSLPWNDSEVINLIQNKLLPAVEDVAKEFDEKEPNKAKALRDLEFNISGSCTKNEIGGEGWLFELRRKNRQLEYRKSAAYKTVHELNGYILEDTVKKQGHQRARVIYPDNAKIVYMIGDQKNENPPKLGKWESLSQSVNSQSPKAKKEKKSSGAEFVFSESNRLDLGRYSLIIPDGFSVNRNVDGRAFWSWLPDATDPKDRINAPILLMEGQFMPEPGASFTPDQERINNGMNGLRIPSVRTLPSLLRATLSEAYRI